MFGGILAEEPIELIDKPGIHATVNIIGGALNTILSPEDLPRKLGLQVFVKFSPASKSFDMGGKFSQLRLFYHGTESRQFGIT